jgi:hypothetical protein
MPSTVVLVATAPKEEPGTFLPMATPHGLINKHQIGTRLRRIGRLVSQDGPAAHKGAAGSSLSLLRAHKAMPTVEPSLDVAPSIRSAVADGRIKALRISAGCDSHEK